MTCSRWSSKNETDWTSADRAAPCQFGAPPSGHGGGALCCARLTALGGWDDEVTAAHD
jgi:hypothetical protein